VTAPGELYGRLPPGTQLEFLPRVRPSVIFLTTPLIFRLPPARCSTMRNQTAPSTLSGVRRLRALTVIELVAVSLCVGILAIIGALTYSQIRANSQNAAVKLEVEQIARNAQSIARSGGAISVSPTHLEEAAAEMSNTSAASLLFAASEPMVIIPDMPTGGQAAGDVMGQDYGPSMSYGTISYMEQGTLLGIAARSESGDCVLGLATGVENVDVWLVGSDIGAECRGGTALAGYQDPSSYTYQDPLSYGSPAQVIGLTFDSATDTTADISWTASTASDLAGYKVYVNGTLSSGATPLTSTSYTITGLSPNSLYTVRVSAIDVEPLEGLQSDPVNAITVPATPTGLAATAVSDTEISISWDNQAYSTFRLYLNAAVIYTGTGTSFSFTSADPATTYSFQIDATNASGGSPISAAASATTYPAGVSDFAFSAAASDQESIGLTWTASDGVISGYKIYRDSTASPIATILDPAADNYLDTGRTAGANHSYYIRTYNATGDGTLSSAVVGYAVPADPATPSSSLHTTSSLTVSWSAVSGASSYQLYRNASLIATQAGTSYADSGLTDGTNYAYQVKACNLAGCSGSSASHGGITKPAAVTGFSATANSSSVDLGWTESTSAVLSGYKIYYKLNSDASYTLATTASAIDSYQVTGLTPGLVYNFKVAAYNASGETSSSVESIAPYTVPDQPAAPTLSNYTTTSIELSWTAPTDGGSAITGYQIYRGGSLVASVGSAATSYTDTGLTAGTNYSYQILAQNIAGSSPFSGATTAPTLPAAATAVAAASGNTQIAVSWTNSVSPVVSGYKVYYRAGTTGAYTLWTSGSSSTSPTTITGLTNGTTYEVYVSAYNASGATDSATDSALARTVPAQVDAPNLSSIGLTDLTVSWSEPSNDGGSAVLSYNVYRNSVLIASVSGGTSYGDTGLTAGTNYSYQVEAVNVAGASPLSAATTAPTLPAAATAVAAEAGYEEVPVSWTDSVSPVVSGYKVYYRAGTTGAYTEWTAAADDASPETVTGLTGKQLYSFKVVAYNASGSTDSSVATATPYTIPTAPGTPTFSSATSTSITVAWTAPDDNGGSTVTSYEVVLNGTLSQSVSGTTTTATFSTLTAGTNYSFAVRAQNAASWGAYSASGTYPTLPAAATAVAAASGNTQVTVSWTDSVSPVVSGYKVYYRAGTTGSYDEWTAGTDDTSPATITGLTNGTTYEVYVSAYNASGATDSATDSALARTTPSAPSGLALSSVTTSAASFTWTASNDGGSALSSYTVYRNGATIASISGSATSYTDSTVADGTTYSYTLLATNIAGSSPASSPLSITTRPAAATDVAAEATSGSPTSITVSWTDSTSAVVAGYKLYYRAGTTGAYTEWTAGTDDSSGTAVTGLIAGTSYYFRVDAYVNNGGTAYETASSVAGPVTAITTPDQVGGEDAASGGSQVSLSWSSITPTSAKPLTGYKIYYRLSTSTGAPDTATSTTNSIVINGLVNGSSYDFDVVAYNVAGESPVASLVATPYTTPAAPTITDTTFGYAQITVSFTAGSNGGNSITDYTAYVYDGATLVTSLPAAYTGNSQSITVPAGNTLPVGTSGTTYTVKVSATNAAGESSQSTGQNGLVYSTPSAPGTPALVSQGSGQIAMSWTAATATYGSAISGYRLDAFTSSTSTATSAGNCTAASTATTCTVTGLDNATTYYFRSRAQNTAGFSSYSSASTGYNPATAPDAPAATGSYAYAPAGSGTGAVSITVGIPAVANNGSTVTGGTAEALVVSSGLSAGTCTVSGASAGTCAINGLNPQVAYSIRTKRTNGMGDSSWYTVGSLTAVGRPTIGSFSFTVGTPAAQGNGEAQYKNYAVDISWGTVAYNGSTATASPFSTACTVNTSPVSTDLAATSVAAAGSSYSYNSNLVTTSGNGAGNTTATSRTCTLTASGTAPANAVVGDHPSISTASTTVTSATSTSTVSLPGYAAPYPGHYPAHYPSHYPTHYGGHYPTHYGGHYPSHYGGHYPSHYGGHYPAHYGGHYPSHYGGHYPHHYGGHYPRHYPAHYGGHYPSHYGGHYPRHYPNQYYPPLQRRY
jgi:hypothetical protein